MVRNGMPPVHGERGRVARLTAAFGFALMFSAGLWAAQPKAGPLRIAESARVQMRAIKAVKTSKGPIQNKIDSRLYLGLLHQRSDPRLAPLTSFRFVVPESDGRVPVDILVTGAAGVKPVIGAVESLGGLVKARSYAVGRIIARVHLADLETLAAMPEVRKLRQVLPRFTHKIKAVNTSEGDATHGAAEARSFFGVTGSGVKVGVISDGVDSLAALQASGDLPPTVEVLPGQAGSGNEGAAMLEIVHDLAPGAALAFATADPDEATFAANILGLAAAGCNIIVDDIIYLDESPFEDGPVAQAVNAVTAAGVLYFSSAGNEGNKDDLTAGTWEGDFAPSAAADPGPLAGANLHDFGDGGNSILVEFGGGNPPLLIWAEHYDLMTGVASTDFDLYDMDGGLTVIFDASTEVQDGVGGDDFPIEFISGGTFGGERLLIDKFAAGTTSSVPMFNLIVFRGELDDNLVTGGATRGHSGAADAFSVAATPAAASADGISPPGPYPGLFTGANASEDFTSDGPRRIILSPTGVELTPGNRTSTGGVVRQKPDITAADGVSCAAPGFNPFYGTSAAAPHAAAIAALLKSAVPALTPAQVRTALVSTAIDIETPGTDRDTGAGIVMAHAALAAAGAVPQAILTAGTAVPTEYAGDGDAYVEPNEVWNLTVPLTNAGGVNATAITSVLSTSTPGVTLLSANSAYADLAPAASGDNATPFRFLVTGAVPCGADIQFTLMVTYTGGPSPQSFNFSIPTGQPGAPVTFSYTGPPVPIPDSPGANVGGVPANATLAVAGLLGNIKDVDFSIDGTVCSTTVGSPTVGLDHTFVNDLQITLRSPASTEALVINRVDGGANNFCQTELDDDSAGPSIQSVGTGDAPFTGDFKPAAALAIFNGESGNGDWQLQAQDFFIGDTGNIRAFSLIITPAVCDAPVQTVNVSGTKTVSGTHTIGSTVTYTVVLTNTGNAPTADNPGNEFVDVLPAGLTLVSANATSGTAVATVGTNTVTWNGGLAGGASVTITVTATIKPGTIGTTITNQGTINYDSDFNGTNDATTTTDDPAVGGAHDPTSFLVTGAIVTASKAVAGTFSVGSTVTYTVILTNSGNAASGDNPGNEFTDVLPPTLTLVNASATSGTAVATIGTNTVTWNGSIGASSSVTITITAIINVSAGGMAVSNQGTVLYDMDSNGTNETTVLTDDPSTVPVGDPTIFVAIVVNIPTLSTPALLLLIMGLAFAALLLLRRL